MRYLFIFFVLLAPTGFSQPTTFYFVDVGHGNATFIGAPSGEVVLLDCGPPDAADRIANCARQNGIRQVDYLVVSHFEGDHMGAAPKVSEALPIRNWVDHGESVTLHKSYEWWAAHRTMANGPPPKGMPKSIDDGWEKFRTARERSGNHIVVKPGDSVPVKGLDVKVLSGLGKTLAAPLRGAGQPNRACAGVDKRPDDDAEDGQSVGVLITAGKFRMIYLGDLTWSTANALFCPNNLVGTVDAYLITHHGQSVRQSLGPYYYGISCCSIAEVRGLHPRVAFLSLGAVGHGFADPPELWPEYSAAMKVVRASPGLEDLWQTNKVITGGEATTNPDDQFIANIGGPPSEQVRFLKLVAESDGSFTVTNSRTGFTKSYSARR